MGANLNTVDLGTGRKAKKFDMHSYTVCAILDNNDLKCWGRNERGHLGLGDTSSRGDGPNEMGDSLPAIDLGTNRYATSISVGSAHSCAILNTNDLVCWGEAFYGKLGNGDSATHVGDDPGEMGNLLTVVDLGAGRYATKVDAGYDTTCVILDNGSVKCFGRNDSGMLGIGDTNDRGDAPGEMGNTLQTVNLGTNRTAKDIFVGPNNVCAILDNNATKCWGRGSRGFNGQGNIDDLGDSLIEMGDNLPAIDFGTNRTATSIAMGDSFACAILDNGSLKCWGRDRSGSLGQNAGGDTFGDDPGEMGNALNALDLGTGRTVQAVTAGYEHACALLDNLNVKCWGSNSEGELGYGDTQNRGDSPNQMGDFLSAVALE